MILQAAALEKPHISANELAKYPFITPKARVRMLRDQKFKNEGRASYYSPSETAIRRALKNGVFDDAVLSAEWDKIHPKDPTNKIHLHKSRNNKEMVQRFMALADQATPAAGEHSKPRSASLELEGVTISIRPEILTESRETGFFSFTKFYFFKGPISADAAEMVLLLLIKYGQAHPRPNLRFDLGSTKLIDCYGGTVIHGHAVPRYRERQLLDALKDINRLWPTIQPKPSDGFLYEGPGG